MSSLALPAYLASAASTLSLQDDVLAGCLATDITATFRSVFRLDQLRLACLAELCQWFLSNGLAINPDKSEAIVMSTAQRSRRTNMVSSIDVAGHSVPISKSLKLLGVKLDEHLTFNARQQHLPSGILPPTGPAAHQIIAN